MSDYMRGIQNKVSLKADLMIEIIEELIYDSIDNHVSDPDLYKVCCSLINNLVSIQSP